MSALLDVHKIEKQVANDVIAHMQYKDMEVATLELKYDKLLDYVRYKIGVLVCVCETCNAPTHYLEDLEQCDSCNNHFCCVSCLTSVIIVHDTDLPAEVIEAHELKRPNKVLLCKRCSTNTCNWCLEDFHECECIKEQKSAKKIKV